MDNVAARPEETVGGYPEGLIIVNDRNQCGCRQMWLILRGVYRVVTLRHGAPTKERRKLYLGLDALESVGANSEGIDDSRQIGQRAGAQFSHDVAAMDLDCDLADP